MNRTALALANPTHEIERTEDAQQLHKHGVCGSGVEIRFRIGFGRLRNRPPDQAIAREGLCAAIGDRSKFRHGSRNISAATVKLVWWTIYGESARGNATMTVPDIAIAASLTERHVTAALAVLRKLGLTVIDDPRHGYATRIELRPGNMSWSRARHVATTIIDKQRLTAVDPPPSALTAAAAVSAPLPEPPPALPATTKGDLSATKGDLRSSLGFTGGFPGTTTTRSAVAPPPSSPKQRQFATDLGVDVHDLDVAAASQVIELARFRRIQTDRTTRLGDHSTKPRRRRHRDQDRLLLQRAHGPNYSDLHDQAVEESNRTEWADCTRCGSPALANSNCPRCGSTDTHPRGAK